MLRLIDSRALLRRALRVLLDGKVDHQGRLLIQSVKANNSKGFQGRSLGGYAAFLQALKNQQSVCKASRHSATFEATIEGRIRH